MQGELSENPRIKAKAKAGRLTAKERATLIEELTKKMHAAAKQLDFESAVTYRDRIRELQNEKK